MTSRSGVCALAIALVGPAAAEPLSRQPTESPALVLTHEPPPRHLRMRPRTAATATAPTPPRPAVQVTKPDDGPEPPVFRDFERPVSARFNLGYVVDGTTLTNTMPSKAFATLRAYGFGEGYLSTRGVGFDSLSTYFAARFQLTRQVPSDPNNPVLTAQPPPIATWFERSGVEPRAVWAEAKDFLPDKRLAPLRVRAGELFVYGPWVLHMYGALAGWDGKLISGTFYGGSRVPDYTLVQVTSADRAGIGGSSLRIDLRELSEPIPFTIGGEVLGFTAAGSSQASNHSQVELDWRPTRDFALIGKARATDQRLVNEHVQLRGRYKQVTNIVVDFTHRHSSDWRWDPSVTDPDPLAARRYLDLGPVLPQVVASLRAGTLIWENIDVYARGAIASDLTADDAQRSTYSARYLEAGGALEVRMRRTIAIGVTALTRQTDRLDQHPIVDQPTVPDLLPPQSSPALGERSFVELGMTVRMSLGARKFSLLLEGYGRRTHYANDYCDPMMADCTVDGPTGIPTRVYRGGGRVTIDAWIGKRLRLFASYDLSTKLDFTPEITGYKSLRLMMEGNY
jgi:hypothetical protein